jgi:hypothetical protein
MQKNAEEVKKIEQQTYYSCFFVFYVDLLFCNGSSPIHFLNFLPFLRLLALFILCCLSCDIFCLVHIYPIVSSCQMLLIVFSSFTPSLDIIFLHFLMFNSAACQNKVITIVKIRLHVSKWWFPNKKHIPIAEEMYELT